MRGTGRIRTAFLVLLSMLLAGCTVPLPVAADRTTTVTVGRTTVQASSGQSVVISGRPMSDPQRAALADLEALSLVAGTPTEISATGPLPDDGVTLTRSWPSPLPDDATATLGYFDEVSQTWVAVRSSVSADRRSVSATVHHLSLWDDFVSTTGRWATDAADAAYYQVGKVFDTRVDPPTCDVGQPLWVSSTVFIATHVNNPILFCAGADANNASLLTVKARNNRGFGYSARVYGTPGWTSNSTWDHSRLETGIKMLTDLDEVAADLVREFTSDDSLVGPGEEFRVGITEAQARQSSSAVVLRLSPQAPGPFLVTVLAKQLVSSDLDMSESLIVTIMGMAKCFKDVSDAADPGRALKAANSCLLGSADTETATLIGRFLSAERGIDASAGAKLGGTVVGKLSMYLALIGPAFNTLGYVAEGMVDDAAHTVSVFPSATGHASASPSASASHGGHSYELVPGGRVTDWASAISYCRSRAGYPAHVDSAAENDFLYAFMTRKGIQSAYFGYSDSVNEGEWVWSDQTDTSYTNWAPGEPNSENPQEDYAMFYWKYTDGRWNDGDFGAGGTVQSDSAFLCEFDS